MIPAEACGGARAYSDEPDFGGFIDSSMRGGESDGTLERQKNREDFITSSSSEA
jgi:hypothetical protein